MKIKNVQKVEGRISIGDPYIFGAYHYDKYPKGNGKLGPDPALLKGRNLGSDFDNNQDWRMYHGETIPGFPHHPHRGFEIVTIVSEGYADHFDSKGSKGRYGEGDVQLMSAGAGVLHGEMFPLVHDDKDNPLRLFQIWMNLPAKSKLTEPDYKMLWRENIPQTTLHQEQGKVYLKVILGEYAGVKSIDPLKHSWAMDPAHHVGIVLVDMEPNTTFTLQATSPTMNRYIFFYDGKSTINVEGHEINERYLVDANGGENIQIKNGTSFSKLIILEGEPINEPVAAYGPFVMNTEQELRDAFREYQVTEFGGWPWGDKETDLVHPKDAGRFASYHFDKVIDKPE